MGYADGAMHFFLDDYRFELCWSRPIATLSRVLQARTVLTPDFSLYSDFPIAAQIWNTYRNRWLGAYWHSEGRVIIPTITWSEPRSYDFCFDGIASESPVAVSTQGVKANKGAYEFFKHGYREMMNRIKPRFVVCYGKITEDLKEEFPDSPVTCYPTYWEGLRAARKAVAEGKTQSIDSIFEEEGKLIRFGKQENK